MSEKIEFIDPKTEAEATVPEDVFPVPAGARGYVIAAEIIFPVIAKEKIWFMRDGTVHEIFEGDYGHELKPLEVKRAVSVLEEIAKKNGFRIARFEAPVNKETNKPEPRWRTMTMPVGSMEILLGSNAAIGRLPRIRNVVASPILVQEGQQCKILTQGHHEHNGGTYVSTGAKLPEVSWTDAAHALLGLHVDFDFITPSDKARAIAVMLSPALRMGGFIRDDFPIHIAEALEPQTGKNLLQKIHAAIYNEVPTGITPAKGGVGSLDEKLSQEMIKGRPFICLSNMRGAIDSSVLEEAIRGTGRVSCRASYSRNVTVDTRSFIWQMSTNGAEFTRDFAARAIITRIRKRGEGHAFKKYQEGDLLEHVKVNRVFYLACVFEVIKTWVLLGKTRTSDGRHDFKGWTQSLDFIVQNFFQLPPLLDGHQAEQKRTGNPRLQWLRDLANAVLSQNLAGKPVTATGVVAVCDEAGITLPGRLDSKGEPNMIVGQVLGCLFKEGKTVDEQTVELEVDGIKVRRVTRKEFDPDTGKQHLQKEYIFTPEQGPVVGE